MVALLGGLVRDATRSSRSRTASRSRTGTAGRCSRSALGKTSAARRRRPLRHQPGDPAAGHRAGRRERDPRQGEPDRHAHRDARGDRASRAPPATRRSISHRSGETEDTTIADLAVATRRGPDQDRLALPLRPRRASTTGCSASRRSSARGPAMRARPRRAWADAGPAGASPPGRSVRAQPRRHPPASRALGAGRDGARRGRPRSLEDDQRAVVRHVVQDGYGADIVFAAGTTGEWHRLANPLRQQVVRVCAEEVAKLNATLPAGRARRRGLGRHHRPHARGDAREPALRRALGLRRRGAGAALDPRPPRPGALRGARGGRPARRGSRAASRSTSTTTPTSPPTRRCPHIRTRQVKALSRLDFVRGIKVSAPRKVMGNYTKAAASFNERGEFGIYVGDALQIFEHLPPAHRRARHARGALAALAPARRAADRRRRGPGERAAARVGARLAGVPRRRRRAHGARAQGARGLPRRHARDGRQARRRVPEARAAARAA